MSLTTPLHTLALTALLISTSCVGGNGQNASSSSRPFHLEEATIESVHRAILSGRTTCTAVVQAYINRAKAYNGVCTKLITVDGAPVPADKGYVRAGSPLVYPTETVAAATILPHLNEYKGLPLDFGRIEPTASDPTASRQMGMRVGIPDAGQLSALETLNIRGERSISCKGAFDSLPPTPLPPNASPACEAFRKQPDALEQARALDAQYGTHPPLDKLSMYCITVALKDAYDTKDMRTTAGSDVNFAMDVPPSDSTIAAELRAKGAIIYAKTTLNEFNAGPGNPGGTAKARTTYVEGGQAISFGGQACNPYDTERVPRGSSSGSGVAVSANLVGVSICEQTVGSCQGPASRNGTALLLTTKGLLPDGGGIGNQFLVDRAGIHARTLKDAALVLDAMRGPERGYFDIRDPFAAVPMSVISAAPYASFAIDQAELARNPKPLKGIRIGLIREHFVKRTPNHVAISDQIDREIKSVLRDQLGAELVETVTPDYPDDPAVPNMTYSFADAFTDVLPGVMPEIFSRRTATGELRLAVPGFDVSSYDYLLKLSRHEAPLSNALRIDTITELGGPTCGVDCSDARFDLDKYLRNRGDARITNWASWVANAKFRDDATRAGAENWANLSTPRDLARSGRFGGSAVGRLVLQRVMYANRIDAFVHPENTVPTPKIGGPNVGSASQDGITPFLQIPKIVVPAGFNQIVYEPQYALNPNKTGYMSVLAPGTLQTTLRYPMPIAMTLFAAQGDEPVLIKIGTAYEAAAPHHRRPPSAFPALPGEP